jgi:hypothetical protein
VGHVTGTDPMRHHETVRHAQSNRPDVHSGKMKRRNGPKKARLLGLIYPTLMMADQKS